VYFIIFCSRPSSGLSTNIHTLTALVMTVHTYVGTYKCVHRAAGLPDAKFANQESQSWYPIFSGHLVYLLTFGIFVDIWSICGHLVCLWTFGILVDICYVLWTWHIL
jgi:hypothetical protein